MQVIENFDRIEEATDVEFKPLPAKPYGCIVSEVIDHPENQFLEIHFDIAEKGEYQDYFAKHTAKGYGSIRCYYTDKALSFFKRTITAFEKTNKGYKFDFNEKSLVGKKCVIVFAEREYVDQDTDEVKIATDPREIRSYDALKENRIKPLKKRTLEDQGIPRPIPKTTNNNGFVSNPSTATAAEINDDDLPF